MFVSDILSSLKGDNLEIRNDDDRVDRLNYRWTVILLIIFAALVTAQTYVMSERINCWVPAHFKGGWEKYVNNYCWIRNTYYLPWDEHVPLDHETRDKYPIVYYQWVPLFMLVQAMFFYAPVLLWRSFNSRTGIDVNDIVEAAERVQRSDDDDLRKKWLGFLTRQLDSYLGMSRKPADKNAGPCPGGKCNCKWFLSACCFCCMGRHFGNYMCILYMSVKVLFVANAIGQIFILNWFLGRNFNMYGFKLIKTWFTGETIEESPYFPRVTFCDVEVRRLGNLHRYTVQCVLPINMFNEKIYAFLWFWFFMLAAITACNLITWCIRFLINVDSYRYIKKRLVTNTSKHFLNLNLKTDRDRLKFFVKTYLRQDGVLVIRLVDYNTNKVTVEDVLGALYLHHLKKKYNVEIEDNPDEPNGNHDDDDDDDTDEKKPLPSTPGSSASSDTDNLLQPTADTHV